ncbi:MAG: hypothetical protein KF789_08900 [Bdellovibrionaceae bacterium]|nr:hypothetical protein [Pseudobdellovibrionaceae bacterium]
MRFLACAFLFFSLMACSTRPTAPEGLNLISESQYHGIVDRYTQRSQKYSGLYNTMDVTATLVNSAVARAQADQKARLLQWAPNNYSSELEKLKKDLKNETTVFVSFYTPDKKNDDLQKMTTQWRVYLEAEGRRWEPKIMKIRQPVAETQGLYAYHTRFSTAYVMTFPVATTTIDGVNSRFIITGPLGISTLDYKPVDATLIQP